MKRKYKVYSNYNSRVHPACVAAAKKAKTDVKNAKRNFEYKLAQNIKRIQKSLFAYARSKSKVKMKVCAWFSYVRYGVGLLGTQVISKCFSQIFARGDTTAPNGL